MKLGSRVLISAWLLLTLGFEWEGRLARLSRELENGDPRERREVVRRMASYPTEEVSAPLLKALEDSDPAVRLEAARSVGEVRLDAATPILREWLEDPDADVRAAAGRALGQIGDPRPVGALVRALGDAAPEVRRAAVGALAHLAQRDATLASNVAVPLLARMDDDDPEVRIAAAQALATLGDPRAVVPLVGRARDTTPEVRVAVYRALGELGDRRAAAALIQSLRDDDENARLAATAALGRIRAPAAVPALRELTTGPDPRLAQSAVLALGRIATSNEAMPGADASDGSTSVVPTSTLQAEALSGIIDALRRASTRPTAQELLIELEGDALTLALAQRLAQSTSRDESLGLIASVERRLERKPFPAAAVPLRAALEEGLPDGQLRGVLKALALSGDRSVLVPIVERLDTSDEEATHAALDALGAYFAIHPVDGRAADPLLAILGNVAPADRVRVVRLLGKTGAARALRALEPLLEHESADLRRAAAQAIGEIGPGGARALLPLLDSDDARIRFEAARSVGASADEDTLAILLTRLRGSERVDRHALLEALGPALANATVRGQLRSSAAGTLMTLANGRDERLAARAVEALARWGRRQALVRLATQGGRHAEVARLARLALGRGDLDDAARGMLRSYLERGDAAAAIALGEQGTADSVAAMVAAARSRAWPGAPAAAFGLARMARRGLVGAEHTAALCELVKRRDPHLRANIMVALTITATPCPEVRPNGWLGRGHAAVVRSAAARWLAAAYPQRREESLRECAEDALSPELRSVCRQPDLSPLGEVADVYAYALDGQSLLREQVVALRFSDGTSLVVATDANAHVRFENAPVGELTLDDPLAAPLEP